MRLRAREFLFGHDTLFLEGGHSGPENAVALGCFDRGCKVGVVHGRAPSGKALFGRRQSSRQTRNSSLPPDQFYPQLDKIVHALRLHKLTR
jgi:hypothetical protein